jgi:pimeloyl-ACP methyl ester carboxylesterase
MATTHANGAAMHYELTGTGLPIVFVHGGWTSADMWAPQVERFAEEYRVLTYDVRGHGRTGGSAEPTYSIERFVADLRALIEDCSLDSPVICGLSLGGMIAQTYANRYPGDVRGLVLAGTMESFPPLPISRLQQETLFPRLALYPWMHAVGARSSFRLLLNAIRVAQSGRPWLALDEDVRRYARREVRRIETSEFVKVFDAMYEFDSRGERSITAPTLVLTGDHEAAPVVTQSDRLAERIENATRVTIPDAGHLSNLDNSEAFNEALGRFLTDR